MNPLFQLENLLSKKGIEQLRSKFILPEGFVLLDYDAGSDTYSFLYFTGDPLEEKTGTYTFSSLVKSELFNLLEETITNLDLRIFSINSQKDRESFTSYTLTRLDNIVDNWINSPLSSKYPELVDILNEFKETIKAKLLPYTVINKEFQPQKGGEKSEIDLPIDFELPAQRKPETIQALDIRQSALLFYFLKEHNTILNLTNTALAKLVSALTGHSFKNLRTEEGFGAIGHIMQDIVKNKNYDQIPNYNLNAVKKLLLQIIDDINKEIDNNNKLKKK